LDIQLKKPSTLYFNYNQSIEAKNIRLSDIKDQPNCTES